MQPSFPFSTSSELSWKAEEGGRGQTDKKEEVCFFISNLQLLGWAPDEPGLGESKRRGPLNTVVAAALCATSPFIHYELNEEKAS